MKKPIVDIYEGTFIATPWEWHEKSVKENVLEVTARVEKKKEVFMTYFKRGQYEYILPPEIKKDDVIKVRLIK